MDDRFNTIAGWALFAGIIALGAGLLTGEVFHDEEYNSCEEGNGYCPPEVAAETIIGPPVEEEEPIAFYLATADASRGENVFKKCAACHTINAGGPNGVGPNLHGVLGEGIGTGAGGFAFSDALAGHGGTWGWDNTSEWLKKPSTFAPGTKMSFAGLSDPQDRADLLLYLNSQGSNLPVPPPPAPKSEDEAAAEGAATEGDLETAPDTGQDITEEEAEGTGSEGGVDVPEGQ